MQEMRERVEKKEERACQLELKRREAADAARAEEAAEKAISAARQKGQKGMP